MRLPDRLARFNRHVTNPIQRLWAGKLPGFGIIEHVGRRSGRAYRTPVNVFDVPGGYAVLLSYGPDRDWVRNLQAANGGKVVRRGQVISVTDPEVVPAADVSASLSKGPATILRKAGIEYVLKLKRA